MVVTSDSEVWPRLRVTSSRSSFDEVSREALARSNSSRMRRSKSAVSAVARHLGHAEATTPQHDEVGQDQ